MRFRETDHPDHQRRIGQAFLLDLDLGGGGLRILAGKHSGNHLAGAVAGIAFKHDEAPRRELAMIGHAGAHGEDGLKLGRRGARAAHLPRFYGAAGFQEVDGVGHCRFFQWAGLRCLSWR